MCYTESCFSLELNVLKHIYFAFVHPHVLYGVKVYANTGDVHLQKLITLNNKLLRILQSKSYNYPVKDLYLKFNTLPIPELQIHQLLKLTHESVHYQYLLPNTFANYFTQYSNK